jgi:cytochrome c oxidase cbb3-type subunit III
MRAIFLSLLTLASASAADEDVADLLRDPAALEEGGKLFRTTCSGCHGMAGEGGRGPNLSDGILVRRATNERLYNVIKNGVTGSDMPGYNWEAPKLWRLVAYLRSFSAPAFSAPPPGDPQAGRQIYLSKGRCNNCHAIKGEGGVMGPDLTDIGATRTVLQLRESIEDPSYRIAEGFQPAKAVTADGRTISGVAKNANNYSVQILDKNGQLHLLDRATLKSLDLSLQSPMPGDYKSRLTKKERDDLLAFLSRQAIREQSPVNARTTR